MSKNTKTTTTSFSWSKFFKFISFVAVILIGLSLIFSIIIPINGVASALQQIGNILAYIIVLLSSLRYVTYKRNVWYYVAWAVACVLIVLYVIL